MVSGFLLPARPRSPAAATLLGVAAALAALCIPAPAAAQFDAEVERRMLADLLRDGKYRQALSEARRIEKIIRPAKKAAAGPGSRMLVELLIYRGGIERRMGNLDAADKSVTEAYRLLSDAAYQQYVTRNAPAGEKEQEVYHLANEIPYLQLLDTGIEVLLERIRAANDQRAARAAGAKPGVAAGTESARGTGSGERAKDDAAADDREQIVSWFRRLDDMIRKSQAARGSLRGRFAEPGKRDLSPAEAAYAESPQARVAVSLSRPYRLVGMRYLEASKLPWTLSFDTDSGDDAGATGRKAAKPAAGEPRDESPEERQRQAASQRRRAAAYLQRSAELGEEAMAPVLALVEADESDPDGNREDRLAPAVRLAARKEAARARAERLVPMAEVVLLEGNLEAARALVDSALAALREAEVPNHPELARPLITSAEVSFALARRCQGARDAVGANWQANAAVQALTEARTLLTAQDSAFDAAAPIHAWLSSQLAVAESFVASSSQTAAQRTAADAAARRALQAMKGVQKAPPKPAPAEDPPPKQ